MGVVLKQRGRFSARAVWLLASLVAFVALAFTLLPIRQEVSTGATSYIGKSGDFKSPGGQPSQTGIR